VALVEPLGEFEGSLCRESEQPVGVALQLGEVVEPRRWQPSRLRAPRLDDGTAGERPRDDSPRLLPIRGKPLVELLGVLPKPLEQE